MGLQAVIASVAVLASPVLAGYVQTQALIGFGLSTYDPMCSETCMRSFQGYMLACTEMHGGGGGGHGMMSTTPECYASDSAYLSSAAYCMNQKCSEDGAKASKIESFWEMRITGHPDIPPKWSWAEALANCDPSPPTYTMTKNDTMLNFTSIVNPNVYISQWNVLSAVYRESIIESGYSIIIIVLAVGIPIMTTWLGYMPFVPALYDRLRPYLVWPSTIGNYQVQSLPYLLGNPPTIGQAIYLSIFFVINILCAINYESRQPSAWYGSQWGEIMAYVFYRFGAFSFVLFPVVVLFSSRNNVLLWVTNWSHSTYLLLHRWMGRLFALYAILHSITGLMIYASLANTDWWNWGAVATVFSVVLMVGGGLYVRKSQYEFFLISHIVLAVFTVVGCWYHIIGWYNSMGMNWPEHNAGGYEVWLYFTIAVWFFDRLVRVVRMAKLGVHRSRVTAVGDELVRVDIPDVRLGLAPGLHLYAYFPTLSLLRPWENHPFSIIPTAILDPHVSRSLPAPSKPASHSDDPESALKEEGKATISPTSSNDDSTAGPHHYPVGITLFVRKSTGMTKFLGPHAGLLTLLDGPYRNNDTTNLLRCDRLLLIGGGIGITGLLPWVHNHWNVKLAWSVRDEARILVDAVTPALSRLAARDRDVRIGSRLAVAELIATEVEAGWRRIGVVVSGPPGLCDDVRAVVAAAGRAAAGRTTFELEVEAYSW